ncbi:MAG TPA: DNA oxidative demethylase AlkB [Gammaproteobacteria bacterium]|nr:DNA oxidative demethylase AlkB [Gammaproteobacteria bacterium]
MTGDLFSIERERIEICPGAFLLCGFARAYENEVLATLPLIESEAPFRHMVTPGGLRMSVAMTGCGERGWVSDSKGYRYDACDPITGRHWPEMPAVWRRLAREAAAESGFAGFEPDACLINRYEPGAKLSLHQDKDERDYEAPVVSVSLGIPAVFLFGGAKRKDKTLRIPLAHGDVVVWGGPARLYYHGVAPLKEDIHPLLGKRRINLTFRKAL